MGKKIVLAVFGGIALVGVILSIVGFALGGRVATVEVEGDGIYYVAGPKRKELGRGGIWLSRLVEQAEDRFNRRYEDVYTDIEEAVEYADDHDNIDDGDYETAGVQHELPSAAVASDEGDTAAYEAWADKAADLRLDGHEERVIDLPDVSTLHQVDLDIDAGYVRIEAGDKLALKVQGPQEFDLQIEEGQLKVETDTSNVNIKARHSARDNCVHFYLENRDVTTLFTLVVPKGLEKLEASVGMGAMSARNIEVGRLELGTDLGAMSAQGCVAREAELETELGAVDVKGAKMERCSLKTELGAIEFAGEVTQEMRVDCDLGSVSAVLPRPAQYSWKADASLGAVTIDGHSIAGLGSGMEGGDGARPFFQLNCNLGAIEVQFT